LISQQLRTFLAVAQANSFSAAARHLGVSQPYVSRQIKQLETLGGGLLFERLGRSIRMSDLGLDLMGVARRMVDAELEALELLHNAKQMQAGYLRMAAVGPYHLYPLLERFKQLYPKVHVKVTFGDSAEVEKAVVEMDVDIGILAVSRRIPHCDQFTLERGPLVLQVPATHALAGRTAISIRELDAESFIFRESTSTTRKLFDSLLLEYNVQVNSTLELGSREAIRLAVANGLGISYVSNAARDPHPNVHYVAIAESNIQTNATLVWRCGRDGSGITAAFLKTVRREAPAPG
jgi:DNA-binding transcriptional LysR family regulator